MFERVQFVARMRGELTRAPRAARAARLTFGIQIMW